MSDVLEEFDEVVYEEAWEYLYVHNPLMADKIRKAVNAGKKPEELRSRYLRNAGEHRVERACLIENAARHLQQQKQRQ